MPLQSVRAADVLHMAENFRRRAAEAAAENTAYHHLMLRTARELEDLAERLERTNSSELVLDDDEATA